LQSRGQGVRRSSRNVLVPSSRILRGEDMLLGSILYLSKKAPTPRLKMNPWLNIDVSTGKIVLSEKDKQTVSKLDALLVHKFEDDSIAEAEFTTDVDNDI